MSLEKRPFAQDREIERYFRDDFFAELGAIAPLKKRLSPRGDCERIELYQGMPLPAELRQLLRFRDEYEWSAPKLGEWCVWSEPLYPPDPAKGNLAEQLILASQARGVATGLFEYFAWCVHIGSASNGDGYFATFDKRQPENCEVVFWDRQEQQMPFYAADSISSFAYSNHLLAIVHGDASFDARALKKKAKALAARTNLPSHFAALEEAGDFETQYEGHDVARYLYYRSMWIVKLLENEGGQVLDDMDALVSMVDVPWTDLDDAIEKGTLGTSPPAAFYWLWRCFFFDEAALLAKTIGLCRQGENPLIDDMASLIEELQGGRKTIGSIANIHSLRSSFIELALDPSGDE